MKAGYRADVEAAKLRSLLARQHVYARYSGQVIVSGCPWHLSLQVADCHDLKGDQDQHEYGDEWSFDHVRSSETRLAGEPVTVRAPRERRE
jgi:hypothetical protein